MTEAGLRVQFAGFLYDSGMHELRRDGRRVALTPKAFSLLGVLLERRPRPVSHAELRDLVWPRTFVALTALPRLVNEVRRAIGDSQRDPRFVRTVHGFGYAFCGVATDASAMAAAGVTCVVLLGTGEIAVPEGASDIGRDAGCGIRIGGARVSRRHARIRFDGTRAVIEDLGSKNGTWVGGRRIEQATPLVDGDQIGIGEFVLIFRNRSGAVSTES